MIVLTNPKNQPSHLSDTAYYVPDLSANIFSVGQLVDNDCNITAFVVHDKIVKVLGTGHKQGWLFILDTVHLVIPSFLRCYFKFS